jgi:hypothetical protein
LCFIAGTVAEMAPKSKQAEGEENPFLPPPVDLDRIPLVDKDRLIADTKCDFDFSDLQSWLREVFLDQSDEIGLWESNLPLYLFPQIHHFPEFALKCQAHYIPNKEPSSPHPERSFPHHARIHRPDDANPPSRLCVSLQPGNSHRIIPENDLPPKSSNIRAFPSPIRSISLHKSSLSVFHVLD